MCISTVACVDCRCFMNCLFLVLQFKFCNWKEYLLEKLTDAKTLPSNFHAKIVNSVKRCPFRQGMKLEVIDKLCLSTMTVATVEEITGGRLKLRYTWSEVIIADTFTLINEFMFLQNVCFCTSPCVLTFNSFIDAKIVSFIVLIIDGNVDRVTGGVQTFSTEFYLTC